MMRNVLILVVWMATIVPVLAEEPTGPVAVNPAMLKFATPPGLPTCAKAAVLRGDPTKEASVMLAKISAGCRIPWHWHTSSEQVMIASGSCTLETKGEKPFRLQPGAYVFMPGHRVHRLACSTTLTLFAAVNGAYDVHYVDDAGNEIPAADALRMKPKKR